ncbi:PorV/PorQ family protein [Limnochorda pilosa]|uniref:Uncharacterized protein n=1 Tax=Limnochorda pilosa TaxID=1555112 RepID=A0A0K2SIH6_LIMPI|nr:hypothetical protein [Limnochorda pilosa]BAS26890.1 hypothetical protein LIP_1033 [Limnochorda pilosa]
MNGTVEATFSGPRRWFHVALVLLLVIGVELTLGTPVWAQEAFPGPAPGARAYGMGGAYVAVVSDPSALYWNPAALGEQHLQVYAALGGQNLGQVADLIALGQALKDKDTTKLNDLAKEPIDVPLSALAAVGLGPAALGVGAQGVATASSTSTSATAEYRLVVPVRAGVGIPVVGIPALGSLRVGAAASYYAGQHYEWTSGSDPLQNSGSGFGVDLGLKAKLTPWISAGLVAHDVVNTFAWEGEALEPPKPSFQAGVQVTPPILGLTVAADVDSQKFLHVGAEYRLLGVLALRGGYIQPLDAGAAPSDLASLRAGVGVGFLVGSVNAGIGFASDPFQVKDVMVEASVGF